MVKHILIGYDRYKFDIGVITVEPVLFLYMFTNFLYFPVLQSLIFDKVCLTKFPGDFCDALKSNSTFKDKHDSQYHEVNTETSHWVLRTTISLTVPSFIIVLLFLGALGDRISRKIPVILPCVGALCAYISGILNAKFMSASLYYILIGPILNGLCGGFIACLMSVYSYIGHISSPQSKMTRVGIVEAMVFLAGTIGVFVSGVLVERMGYEFTFGVVIVAISIAILYSIFWLDNIAPQNVRNGHEGGCCSWISTFFKESFQCVAKRRPGHIVLSVTLQVITLCILMLCTSGDFDITFLYLRESLDFSQSLYGYYKGLDNFMRGLILLTILPLIKRLTNIRNLPLVLMGLLSFAANFLILGVATEQWIPFLGAIVGMFKGVPSAGLRGTMSAMVSQDEQGRLFGLIAASESLISLLASLMFNELYPATYDFYHGLCYLLGAGLVMIVFFFILYLSLNRLDETYEPQQYQPFLNNDDNGNTSEHIVAAVYNEEVA